MGYRQIREKKIRVHFRTKSAQYLDLADTGNGELEIYNPMQFGFERERCSLTNKLIYYKVVHDYKMAYFLSLL